MTRDQIERVLGKESLQLIEAYLRACRANECLWSDNDGNWTASCGLHWTFEDAGEPEKHGVIHCPRCGGRVEVLK